jgi:hypothetical protein
LLSEFPFRGYRGANAENSDLQFNGVLKLFVLFGFNTKDIVHKVHYIS